MELVLQFVAHVYLNNSNLYGINGCRSTVLVELFNYHCLLERIWPYYTRPLRQGLNLFSSSESGRTLDVCTTWLQKKMGSLKWYPLLVGNIP